MGESPETSEADCDRNGLEHFRTTERIYLVNGQVLGAGRQAGGQLSGWAFGWP